MTPTALYAAMPPAIPTTTFKRRLIHSSFSPRSRCRSADRGYREWKVLRCRLGEGLDDELVFVDLVHGDRQRLVIDRRVDERADVVEEATLVKIGVVVVDLTCALGREDHQGVL